MIGNTAPSLTELKQTRQEHLDDCEDLLNKAKSKNRDMTKAEQRQFDTHMAEADRLAEGVLEKRLDLSRAIDAAQRAVDSQPKVLVAARQRQGEGLEGEMLVGETEVATGFTSGGEENKYGSISEVS